MPQPIRTLQEPVLPTDNEVSSVEFLPRWQPKGDPLYHRHLKTHHFDMCAESLGMPKVALCFLTRGPVHQVSCQWVPLMLCSLGVTAGTGKRGLPCVIYACMSCSNLMGAPNCWASQ